MKPTSADRAALQHRPRGWPVLHMRWEKLLFLHWRWDPADIQSRLPAGLWVDTFQDDAWLGIVPFFMRGVRPTGLPAVPWLSDFLELNVRTYVFDAQGRPGVWFFSLACNQPIAVEIARRTYGLNYVHARMEAKLVGGCLDYHCARQDSDAAGAGFQYEPVTSGEPASPDSLEFFLVERYLLFARTPSGRLVSGRVHHPPYLIRPTPVALWDFHAAVADGFSDPLRPPDHILGAADLAVAAWPITGP